MSDAEICIKNGWIVGDILEGTEHYHNGKSHTDRIVITAIGMEDVLAAQIDENGDIQSESGWTLGYRDWRRVAHVTATWAEHPKRG